MSDVRTIADPPAPDAPPLVDERLVLEERMVHIGSVAIEAKFGQVVAYVHMADMVKGGDDIRYILESPVLFSNQLKQQYLGAVNLTGFWIFRVCQSIGVQSWEELPRRLGRVRVDQHGKIHAIAHVGSNKMKNGRSQWFEVDTEMRQFRQRMALMKDKVWIGAPR